MRFCNAILILFLFMMIWPVGAALSWIEPPGEITLSEVTPPCLSVEREYMRLGLYPVGAEGKIAASPETHPVVAVTVKNKCEHDAHITDLSMGSSLSLLQYQPTIIRAAMVQNKKAFHFWAYTKGRDCNNLDPSERDAQCRAFILPSSDELLMSIPVGEYYEISGYIMDRAKAPVRITGHMIHPLDIAKAPDGITGRMILSFDPEQALEYYLRRARGGEEAAKERVAQLYEKNGDYIAAFSWWQEAAKENVWAKMNVAKYYLEGKGVEKNVEEAIRIYRTYADEGNHQARCRLGAIYLGGQGVPRNDEVLGTLWQLPAERWQATAAKANTGDAQAQVELAVMLGDGGCRGELSPEQWKLLGKKIWLLHERAAAQVNTQATYMMGVLGAPYPEQGNGVLHFGEDAAVLWYRDAAKKGHTAALASLGKFYLLRDKDKKRAIALIHAAAERGESGSQMILARAYEEGLHDLTRNYETALFWRLAANPSLEDEEWEEIKANLTTRQIYKVKFLVFTRFPVSGPPTGIEW